MKQETTCVRCKKQFDRNEVGRIYGKQSSVFVGDYCSSQCYTNEMTGTDEPKDESKEVKEGGELFTGGEWELIRETIGDDNTLQICGGKGVFVASVYEESDAILLTQSKNMYYCLKEWAEKFQHNYPTLARSGTDKTYETTKEILKKANPNY